MGAFGQWLADLGRKVVIYSPVLVLLFGLWASWLAYRGAIWGTLHIPIPFSADIAELIQSFCDYLNTDDGIGFGVYIARIFALDIFLQYFLAILNHIRYFFAAISVLFAETITLMIVAYTYGKAKQLAAITAGDKLL